MKVSKQLTSLFSTLSLSTGSSVLLASMKSAYLSVGNKENVRKRLEVALLFNHKVACTWLRKQPTVGEQRLWKFSKEGFE